MRKDAYLSAFCGALAGLVNGLFGGGGGMVLVPLSRRLRLLHERERFATALAVMLPISAVSFLVYALRGGCDFALALPYCLGGVGGGLLGGLLYRRIPSGWLHRAMGLLLLWGGVRALFL